MLDDMTDAALKVLSRNPRRLRADGRGRPHRQAVAPHGRRPRRSARSSSSTTPWGWPGSSPEQRGDTLVLVLADHECSGFSLIGALTGGIANLQSLAPDNGVLDPAHQPGRQKVVGVYEGAGFPRYDHRGRRLSRRPSTSTARSSWASAPTAIATRAGSSKPLPVIDSLLSERHQAELGRQGLRARALPARGERLRVLPARPGRGTRPGRSHGGGHSGLRLQPRPGPGTPSWASRPTPTSSSRSRGSSWAAAARAGRRPALAPDPSPTTGSRLTRGPPEEGRGRGPPPPWPRVSSFRHT